MQGGDGETCVGMRLVPYLAWRILLAPNPDQACLPAHKWPSLPASCPFWSEGARGASQAVAPQKVQDCLWGGSKFENRKVGWAKDTEGTRMGAARPGPPLHVLDHLAHTSDPPCRCP